MEYVSMIRALGTEQQAADKLKVARSTVWRLLRGAAPSFETMQKLLALQDAEVARRRKKREAKS
jgi:transcriptional regulator with XRE-family HTH domain